MAVENQLYELREFCKRSGWDIEHEYVDKVSGRPPTTTVQEDV